MYRKFKAFSGQSSHLSLACNGVSLLGEQALVRNNSPAPDIAQAVSKEMKVLACDASFILSQPCSISLLKVLIFHLNLFFDKGQNGEN